MQGAGNDFVVLDETQGLLGLTPAHYRFIADRHFGVGADQILSVRRSTSEAADFAYVIHNSDGGEVEQCGNGARCFVRFVREHGLTDKSTVKVQVHGGIITLCQLPDGSVQVDMGPPVFDLALVPFEVTHATSLSGPIGLLWKLSLQDQGSVAAVAIAKRLEAGRQAFDDVIDFIVQAATHNPNAAYAGSVPYLMLAGNVLAGWQLARSFLIAQEALSQGADDSAFLQAKMTTARFYADHILSKVPGMRDGIVDGADSVTEMVLDSF
jgi:hypothetical protein